MKIRDLSAHLRGEKKLKREKGNKKKNKGKGGKKRKRGKGERKKKFVDFLNKAHRHHSAPGERVPTQSSYC